MLHIFLAMNIVAFSLGIVVLILGILSFRRSGRLSFRIFTLLFGGAVLYVLVEILRLYSNVAAGVFGNTIPVVAMVLSGMANGLVGYAIPVLAFQLVNLRISPPRASLHGAAILLLIALGVLDDVFPSSFLPMADAAAIFALQLYGMAVVVGSFRRIEEATVKELARGAIIVSLVMSLVVGAERWLRSRSFATPFVRQYGFAELAYFLAITLLLLVYALKYLFKAAPAGASALPEHFIEKYGISPREREIISMILLGHGNRKISETLFISAMTVKNHIYHIYQKTGVANKIQLINVINSPK